MYGFVGKPFQHVKQRYPAPLCCARINVRLSATSDADEKSIGHRILVNGASEVGAPLRASGTPSVGQETSPAMSFAYDDSPGLMGLGLSIVGLYGLVAFAVSRRTREIGIRMAVGSPHWTIFATGWDGPATRETR